MKGPIFALAALLALAVRTQGHIQCCQDGLMVARGGCANGNRIVNLGCNSTFLLEEITITDGGLSVDDSPGYVWRANDSVFCVGRMNVTKAHWRGIVDVAVVCFEMQREVSWGYIQTYGVLTLISAAFLLLTLSVYIFVPRLRDLQGKCIMCQCGCLALAYLNLGLIQLEAPTTTGIDNCSVHSFLLYFWMMAMIFWLNVVTVNVYRSVTHASYLQKTETRQFLYYSVYAWGAAFVFLMAALVTNYVDGSHLKPGFGQHYNCWFNGIKETWVFFYGPMGVIIVANIIIFALSSLKLWKTSKIYEVGTLTTLKYKFLLYLKLFIVTGVTWAFEVASFAHGTAHIFWTITDVFNALQGFTFFLLLVVFRRRALAGLAERGLGCGLMRRLLLLFRQDREGDNMVGSEAECDDDPAPHHTHSSSPLTLTSR